MSTSRRKPDLAHYEKSLVDQVLIAAWQYRFYIAPNLFVFGRAKVDWMRTKFIDIIIAEREPVALATLIDTYEEMRGEWAPDAPDISKEELWAKYNRSRDDFF